jgi:type IV secretory pathway VirB6-like protein
MPALEHVTDIAHTIQLAIAPVFLLTALGTMLSVFSTRLGRIVDRARILGERLPQASEDRRAALLEEIAALARRRHFVNIAITGATSAALLVCILIAVAFLGAILHVDTARLIAGLFIAVMATFITALVFFLREILITVGRTAASRDAQTTHPDGPSRPSTE